MTNLDKFYQWAAENDINPYNIVVELVQQAMERNINLDRFLNTGEQDESYFEDVYDAPSVLTCSLYENCFKTFAFHVETFVQIDPEILFAKNWDLKDTAKNYINGLI